MRSNPPNAMVSAAQSAETVDELWQDAIDDDRFVLAALRLASMLFGVPATLVHIAGGDPPWHEYCVTGQRFGSAFLQALADLPALQPLAGGHAAFLGDSNGIWRAPAGISPDGDQLVRFCAGVALKSPDATVDGTLWLLDTRQRGDIQAMQDTALADMATLIAARFQAIDAFRYRDRLTHLPNRTQFVRDVQAGMQQRRLSGGSLHAVVIDLASLATISRMVVVLGLGKVERFIQGMTERLMAVFPPEIRLYRLGHARFGFLHAGKAEAIQELALQATTCFEQPLTVEDAFPIAMSAHAGMVRIEDVDSAAEIVSALFAVSEQARAAGHAWMMYDRQIAGAQQRAFTIVHSMRAALSTAGQLRLVYQPRERLSDGAWVAAEALLRWTHPQLGELSPGEVVPLIEATSLMPALTDWVIDEAVRQLAEWNQLLPGFKISINVSPSDFIRTDLVDVLSAALRRHRANGANLEVEITETTAAGDPRRLQQTLQRLRQAGIAIAIDDFGIGYSSLSRWQTLSFDILKLDRAMIRDVADNERAQAIFQWIISLAKKLGQKVVAEGVENESQQRAAARWGCDEAQGYFISHPLTASLLTARLAGLQIEHQQRAPGP